AEPMLWYIRSALGLFASAVNGIPVYNPATTGARDEAPPSYEYMKAMLALDPDQLTFDLIDKSDMVVVGDPDTVAKKLRGYEEAGMEVLLAGMEAGGIPHDKVMKSIELFGEHVIPKFKTQPATIAAG